MTYYEPLYSRIDAYTALRDQLPELETTEGLVRAAVAVSMHELEEADIFSVDSVIEGLAEQVRERVASNNPRALLAHAHCVLFDEARFRGNHGDYENPGNSYLPVVLKTRLGLPITLALLYKAVLHRLGVPVVGINAPGHFMAGVPARASGSYAAEGGISIVDVFSGGRLLTRAEALDRVAQTAGADLLLDERADLLPVATHKQWLLRIIRNLHNGFERRGQHDDRHAMAEMMRLVQTHA